YKEQYYQVIITNLVKKGMIVFVIDPLGQGEHVQYYDTALKFSAVGYSVLEHQYFGHACFLTGTSSAKYFIWDGIRAIDYLLTRKEVDPDNIGVTGFSGGGTVTGYVAAFDERVKVAIPCSWPTAYKALLETKGSQDAETVLIGGLKKGITFEDLLEVRAPKPTLMTFTSRDEYLSLQGARQSYKEAKKAYAALGRADNLQFSEDDAKHAMTPKIRLDMYAFFQKHFNLPGNADEEKTDLPTVEDLTVTPTGQIATYKGGKMIFDLNKEASVKLVENLERSRKNISTHIINVKEKAKQISGYKTPAPDTEGAFINGRYQRDGYTVEKDAIAGESGEYAVPLLLFKPDNITGKSPALIYLHPGGKVADAGPGGEIEKLVKQGFTVVAPDVLGRGETKSTAAGEYAEGNTCVLIGRSMVGIQAGDIVRVVNFVKTLSYVDQKKIGAIAFNEMSIPLIHAAAFEASIKGVTLVGPPVSYANVVNNRLYKLGITPIPGHDYWHPVWVEFNWGVASVLTAYDLPDLIGSIAPRKVVMAEIKNSMMQPAATDIINKELEFPKAAYSSKQASANFKVLDGAENLPDLLKWSVE
ncbi:MAG: acetylxylan esterase, partial [Chitinophagaceae bacterium]|nr:acetylxylan esterase [Chitinophagaceae bacterium]